MLLLTSTMKKGTGSVVSGFKLSLSEVFESCEGDESVDNWGTTSDEEMEDDIIPSEIDVKRAGNSSDISVPASSLGEPLASSHQSIYFSFNLMWYFAENFLFSN